MSKTLLAHHRYSEKHLLMGRPRGSRAGGTLQADPHSIPAHTTSPVFLSLVWKPGSFGTPAVPFSAWLPPSDPVLFLPMQHICWGLPCLIIVFLSPRTSRILGLYDPNDWQSQQHSPRVLSRGCTGEPRGSFRTVPVPRVSFQRGPVHRQKGEWWEPGLGEGQKGS